MAVRDQEVAAQAIGVNLTRAKLSAFALSSGYVGLAGALTAHYTEIVTWERFTLDVSVQYLGMIIVGGLGSIAGSIYGAAFLMLVPPLLSALADAIRDTAPFLQGLVQTLWDDGKYVESPRDAGKPNGPYVYRQPAFYLGNRNQGFADAIERYIEILPHCELPESLLHIVGIETGRGTGRRDTGVFAVDALLTRDANREQRRVIHRLDETGAVLVQGPPGTGKSHTIANLIGHLLSPGQTILVTSHAPKALGLVRDKVAEPLQSLCVSLLDSDEESTMQLEESITGILNYFSSTTKGKLDKDIERLTRTRNALRAEQDAVTEQLLRAISDEHAGLSVLGRTIAPAEAARPVRDGAGVHDWIPGPLNRESSSGDPLRTGAAGNAGKPIDEGGRTQVRAPARESSGEP